MAGLNLMGSAGFTSVASGGVPAAAGTPGAPSTIGQRAFGITSGQTAGPRTGAYGTMIAGAAGTVLLLWMWWTLPR